MKVHYILMVVLYFVQAPLIAQARTQLPLPNQTINDIYKNVELYLQCWAMSQATRHCIAEKNRFQEMPRYLFYGESGTGKTFIATDLAQRLDLEFYRVECSNLVNSYQGSGAEGIKNVFIEIKNIIETKKKPVVLLLDEIDNIGSANTMNGQRQRDAHSCAYAALNQCLDQTINLPILVIATTNYPDALAPELKLRLGREIEFHHLNEQERRHILERQLLNSYFPVFDETALKQFYLIGGESFNKNISSHLDPLIDKIREINKALQNLNKSAYDGIKVEELLTLLADFKTYQNNCFILISSLKKIPSHGLQLNSMLENIHVMFQTYLLDVNGYIIRYRFTLEKKQTLQRLVDETKGNLRILSTIVKCVIMHTQANNVLTEQTIEDIIKKVKTNPGYVKIVQQKLKTAGTILYNNGWPIINTSLSICNIFFYPKQFESTDKNNSKQNHMLAAGGAAAASNPGIIKTILAKTVEVAEKIAAVVIAHPYIAAGVTATAITGGVAYRYYSKNETQLTPEKN